MESLTPEQQAAAILGPKDSRAENQAEMFKDNVIIPYQGLRATGLEPAQKAKLLDLIALYVGNMDDGHAEVKMSEVRAHLDETYFAWRGEIGAEAVFYYRIQSPVLLIEFDHQGPIALEGPRSVPTRRHIHTVVRTPNGNDYGKDLLRRHYEAIEHGSERGNITR